MKWCVDFVRYYDLLFIEACRDRVASSKNRIKNQTSSVFY